MKGLLFEKILREMSLLKEDASVTDINDSISNMHPALITYVNQEGNKQAKGTRKIYPVAYGISTAGNPVIRAFENEGDTTTKVPAWKLFIVPNILSWKTLQDESFKDEELEGLNKSGKDEQIVTLYNVSPLSDSAKKWISDGPEIKSTPIEKQDVNISGKINGKDMVDATIGKNFSEKSIDNVPEKDYFSNKEQASKINAEPETEPITKVDIQNEPVQPAQPQDKERMYANEDPIEKGEIYNAQEDDNEEPEITKTYNDMINRWNTQPEE